jgi:hypothetical protein
MHFHPLFAFTSAAPPPVFLPLPTVEGVAGPRRFVLPPSMAIAAAKLAGDQDALLVIEAITASGILE